MRTLTLLLMLATAALATDPRSASRAEPHDQEKAQRRAPVAQQAPRSAAARRAFLREHPCSSTDKTTGACPDYVVDHIVALKRGGADAPSNMQWQTITEAKAKDRVE